MPPTLADAPKAFGLTWCESCLPSAGDGSADESAEEDDDDEDDEPPLATSSRDACSPVRRGRPAGRGTSCEATPRRATFAAEHARLIGREKLTARLAAGEAAAVVWRLESADDDREATIGRASGDAGAGGR